MNDAASLDQTDFTESVRIAPADHGRLEEVYAVMIGIEREPGHVTHVARLAASLYDQTSHLHRLGESEKFLLVSAALLHDTGWSFSADGTGHHKLSQKFILERDWRSFSLREKSLVANVARYHRKALPNDAHPHFHPLSTGDKSLVRALAALLRLADALDRTHLQIIDAVELKMASSGKIDLWAKARRSADTEFAAVSKKQDLFVDFFGREICCRASLTLMRGRS
ncbi:HD domain-containing protein [Oscillatoria amoena NRMC-F 0135]|nr:HD domain-containing protein [Oscillatoria laete-virens]MDL5051064.1 HD domain-containing protein [Oscillatoria amoena NRMC-F 0135]MDL5054511.1 HD domain-containing protein [Oscillatoria laete-virens NRMC-F 0139]